jgi:hypothetical protein
MVSRLYSEPLIVSCSYKRGAYALSSLYTAPLIVLSRLCVPMRRPACPPSASKRNPNRSVATSDIVLVRLSLPRASFYL